MFYYLRVQMRFVRGTLRRIYHLDWAIATATLMLAFGAGSLSSWKSYDWAWWLLWVPALIIAGYISDRMRRLRVSEKIEREHENLIRARDN